MKKTIMVLALLVAFTLVGCGEKEETHTSTSHQGTLDEVIVEIQTPEKLQVGEEVVLSAKVTQSKEAVNDADSVEFEVWESGLRKEGHMVEGTLTEDGVYEANFTFDHDGVYYMFAHTTARGLHVMPKQELTVGNPDMSKVLPDDSDNSMDHMEHSDGNH
ncbi:FixH family protein [Psychrobacillus sp. Sa2BUA9]|uniref:FixH family protein n=1 Tax=Psychrobacillus faecigallinarum TaxID=2762235 RepID=A0ABR8RCR4_9BACI|nr:FixH family protein [Psychrobacillus faecigallinarum]MBD7945563.1 FixH family protein [Psychrobacillus faecigallinarum]